MVDSVLITGGCGFIGKSLTAFLIERGIGVRVLDNLLVGKKEDLQSFCPSTPLTTDFNAPPQQGEIQLMVGDITSMDQALSACEGVDAVVHLAANTGVGPSVENPVFDCQQNVLGTLNMLEAARISNVSRFVFASSGAPAGSVTPPIHEEVVPKPVSPYGASKLSGEAYCSAYYRTFELQTVALRFGNVYGPGSQHKSSVVAKFINQILAGEPVEIYGDGSQTRDFIYIRDLIEAIFCALSRHNVGGEVFQIATSQETSVSEIVSFLQSLMSARGIRLPEVTYSSPRLGDVKRNYSDISKAKRILGWEPSHTLEDGLEATIEDLTK